jgi:hypothetical protein
MPATVKENEQNADVMFVGESKELVHPRQETSAIFFPKQVMKKYPDAVEPKRLSVAKFPVDCRLVKRVSLPHFELVYGGARAKIATHQPRLASIPRGGLLFGPMPCQLRAAQQVTARQ